VIQVTPLLQIFSIHLKTGGWGKEPVEGCRRRRPDASDLGTHVATKERLMNFGVIERFGERKRRTLVAGYLRVEVSRKQKKNLVPP
jgi:hypothetical protein